MRAVRAGRYGAELVRRAARIRLLLLDVDGVLTDGRLYYGEKGEALKAFDVKDGHGLVLVRGFLELGVISGRGALARIRLLELGFRHLAFEQKDKLAAYERIASRRFPDQAVAYMGDDVNDLPLLARVGLSACPADAHPEVRARARFVAERGGGRGAVRELCDLLLLARARAAVRAREPSGRPARRRSTRGRAG